jgi:Flp pilus assembly protein TadG
MRSLIERRRLRRLGRDARGSASIELALLAPLLVAILTTSMEYVRFLIMDQKLERATAMVADIVSQSAFLTLDEIEVVFDSVGQMMDPFDIGADGSVILTSVSGVNGKPLIQWQERHGAGTDSSPLGSAKGQQASLPGTLAVQDGENVILCETFMQYEPMILQDLFTDSRLYRYAVFRPRFGSLDADPRAQ